MSQNDRLLAYLKKGRSIDPLNAWSRMGIYRLSARIYDLRQQGIEISSRLVEVENKWGEVFRVAQYRIE